MDNNIKRHETNIDELFSIASGNKKNTNKLPYKPEEDVIENECSKRRDIIEANKQILNQEMHEWSNAMEYLTTGVSKTAKKLDIIQSGDNNKMSKWEKHKRMVAEDDDLAGEITRALYPQFCAPVVEEENNYESEIARLQTEKQLRARHEQVMAKSRMRNKIKAKNFHRHARKRDIKQFLKNEGENPNSEEVKERLDRLRAQERISLKHKNSGKFAKLNKLRAKYDEHTREALEEMQIKGQELTRKTEDDDDDDSDEVVDDIMKSDNDDQDEDDDDDMSDNMENIASLDPTMPVTANHSIKNLLKGIESGKRTVKTANVISTDKPMIFDQDEHIIEDSNEVLMGQDDETLFKEAIYQVYQEDEDLQAEFEKDKAARVEKESAKDIDTFVPGWGDWTGPGCEKKDKRKRERGLIKAPKDTKRVDHKKARVFIKDGVHEELKKHLVKTIPYPYNTVEQFELSRSQLVSSAFTMETVHRKLTKPQFKTKPSVPIHPLLKSIKNQHL